MTRLRRLRRQWPGCTTTRASNQQQAPQLPEGATVTNPSLTERPIEMNGSAEQVAS